MKPTREELIEMAKKYIAKKYCYAPGSEIMADFALSLQEDSDVRENRTTDLGEPYPPNDQTFTVRALRKKGTERWYWYDGNFWENNYPENMDANETVRSVEYYYKDAEPGLPSDAELVEIECRVIKTIK